MKYKIYGEIADQKTKEQIESITRSKALQGENIAIMPDNHYGKGAPIGFTSTYNKRIVPNLVGVDIGCGMNLTKLPIQKVELSKLDEIIHKNIPSGSNIHQGKPYYKPLDNLTFKLSDRDKARISNSIGTLGGGNHFIEVAKSDLDGSLNIIIHSGSRKLGAVVATHHQNIAREYCKNKHTLTKEMINKIEPHKRGEYIAKFKKDNVIQKDLEYLEGALLDAYVNDMKISQQYAIDNRNAMRDAIMAGIGQKTYIFSTHTPHNYLDTENKIIRKGAIAVSTDEVSVIPMNMRDGSLIVKAKNKLSKESNMSAPHGAGRRLSRMKAVKEIDLEDYKKTMEGIFSTSISKNTLDEAPFAYKDESYILKAIEPILEVVEKLRPIYNFKDNSEKIDYRKKRK